jgi:fumarylpyruvate hydrolase
MKFIFDPVERVVLPVVDSDHVFPVGQIYCVGRNYAEHAIEMGHDPSREPPFFFMKPGYAILKQGEQMTYPSLSSDVHHEVELVVALKGGGENIAAQDAMELVFGYAVGIDMTRRDLQAQAKDKSRPWEAGKTFRHAAPCSAIVPIAASGEINSGAISLSINGDERQRGDVNQMIWKIPEVISKLSELFVLQPGDLIYTGTPAGVGPICPGDEVEAQIENVGRLNIQVGEAA